MTSEKQFVVFPLGVRMFALPAGVVAELARPDRLYRFPHTTPAVKGVLARNGRIVPVYDFGPALLGKHGEKYRYYLMVKTPRGSTGELIALPVSGECELVERGPEPRSSPLAPYVSDVLTVNGGMVEVLDLEKLIAAVSSARDNNKEATA